MPLAAYSSYRAPLGFRNGHVQTIFPTLLRRVRAWTNETERIELEDGDFLDLDWRRGVSTERLAIISHGLEGASRDDYVQAMAAALGRAGWDVLAWNLRGCGSEPNRLVRFYHSGATEDLHAVVRHAAGGYRKLALVGFSLGGNLTLKYLGEHADVLDGRVVGGVAFSTPCDLACASQQLESWWNTFYMRRFMRRLKAKVRRKMHLFPDKLSDAGIEKMRTFREFDGAYTAPLHGFADAEDYWRRSSCRQFLERITVPTLLVNALDDPFLGPGCYPVEEARASRSFYLEQPRHGGHVGFVLFNPENEYWSEQRACAFLDQVCL